MSDYRELKRLAERAIPDVEWFKANNLSCHSNVDSSAAAFIAKATPAAVLALLAENERLVASLSKPDDITAEPAADYDALRKQFMALRSLANSNSRMVSHWRNRCGIETRETLLANADNVNAERDTNQMLTKALLAAEDERDQLKAENELAGMRIKELDLLFGRYMLAMRSAVIEEEHGKGPAAAMKWIYNSLAGPGELPPEGETDSQGYFDREIVAVDRGMSEIMAFHRARRAAMSRGEKSGG